jgi:hypothetical protein
VSAAVVYDARWDVFRVKDERGQVMADGDGYQLAFEHRADAEDMLTRRAAVFVELAKLRKRTRP